MHQGSGENMASLNFTIDEVLNILGANGMLPDSICSIKAEPDGLLVTVSGGIGIMVRQESFARGVLKLVIASKSWAFKLADQFGKVDEKIDAVIRNFSAVSRAGKTLSIDLNSVLKSKVKGIQVKKFELRDGSVKIEF
jgi:hypothetical protein